MADSLNGAAGGGLRIGEGWDMDERRQTVKRLASMGDVDAIAALDRMDVRLGHRISLIERAIEWTDGWYYPPSICPISRCGRLLLKIIQDHFGCTSGKLGDAERTIVIDGLTFVVMPSSKHKDWLAKGHRLKMKCPICNNLYGPAKWRQHYDIHIYKVSYAKD